MGYFSTYKRAGISLGQDLQTGVFCASPEIEIEIVIVGCILGSLMLECEQHGREEDDMRMQRGCEIMLHGPVKQ